MAGMPALFEPLRLGGIALARRIAVSPMCRHAHYPCGLGWRRDHAWQGRDICLQAERHWLRLRLRLLRRH